MRFLKVLPKKAFHLDEIKLFQKTSSVLVAELKQIEENHQNMVASKDPSGYETVDEEKLEKHKE